jgi:hypothetical protein
MLFNLIQFDPLHESGSLSGGQKPLKIRLSHRNSLIFGSISLIFSGTRPPKNKLIFSSQQIPSKYIDFGGFFKFFVARKSHSLFSAAT